MIVFHYTTAEKLNPIHADGYLKPSVIGIGQNELPVLWFSSNQRWEPTANKALGLRGVGAIRWLTTNEMVHMFQLIRFGIDADKLMPWNQLRKAAHITHTEQRRLITSARKVGSLSHQWFGSIRPIELHELTREDLSPAREWVRNTDDHAPFNLPEYAK